MTGLLPLPGAVSCGVKLTVAWALPGAAVMGTPGASGATTAGTGVAPPDVVAGPVPTPLVAVTSNV